MLIHRNILYFLTCEFIMLVLISCSYRNIRAKRYDGGVGLLVKDNIVNSFNINILDKSTDGLMTVAFSSKHTDFSFVIFIIYLPPEGSPWSSNLSDFFARVISQIYTYYEYDMIFLAGDFNARIGSQSETYQNDSIPSRLVLDKKSNDQGNAFIEFLNDVRFCVLNGRFDSTKDNFTCISGRGESVVDYIAVPVDCFESCFDFEVITPVSLIEQSNTENLLSNKCKNSDHSAVIFRFRISAACNIHESSSHPAAHSDSYPGRNRRYNLKTIPENFGTSNIAMQGLNTFIETLENVALNRRQLDCLYDEFCKTVFSEMDACLEFKDISESSIRKRFKHYKPYWDQELTDLWTVLKETNKRYNKSKRSGARSKQLFESYKIAQKNFDKTLHRKARAYKRSFLSNLDDFSSKSPKQFWEKLDKLGPRTTRKIPSKIRKPDGSFTENSTEVLEKWQNDFSTLYNRPDFDANDPGYIRSVLELNNKERSMQSENYSDNSYLNENILLTEISKAISRLKSGKAVGCDFIPNEILRSPSLTQALYKLFNFCFKNGVTPTQWSKSVISPIPKGSMKDPYTPLNYRGISLLSCVYKLYAYVLNARLYSFLEAMDLLDDAQNGFRSGRSCEDHIHSLVSMIKGGFNEKSDTFCCYIDMQKAFDYLDRDLLLLKLVRMGIDGKFYFALKSTLLDTSACVKVNGNYSDYFKTQYGVRQGDVNSPVCFAVFINDLLADLRANKKNNDIILSNVLAYADDIVLISDDEIDLQRLIDIVRDWCNKWKLLVNLDKTKIVHYRTARKSRTKYDFKWNDQKIEISSGYKYLGVFLDEHLNFESHCENISSSAGRALGKILSKFSVFRDIGHKTFTKVFKTNVESIMNYGVSVICDKPYNFERIQSRAIRYFLGVHPLTPIPSLFGEVGWISFKYTRWVSLCRTWNRYVNMDDDRINKAIFLADFYSNSVNWCTNFYSICSLLDFEEKYENLEPIDLNEFSEKVEIYAENQWKLNVQSKPKLRTYKLFKTTLAPEKYCTLHTNRAKRSVFAQFRCGILPLNIEVGRFRGLSVAERKCIFCDQNEVETEAHFLIKCPFYNTIRNSLSIQTGVNLNDNSDADNLDILMNQHQKITLNNLFDMWIKRRNALLH